VEGAVEPYTETLSVPTGWWLLGTALVLSVFWAFVVATPLPMALLAALVAAALVVAGLARYGAVRVATDPDGFSAGRALLPYRHIGAVEPLDEPGTRRLLGVEADARAYLVARTYCRGAVKVTVADPADPTPYWLVSTRHPATLAARLTDRIVQD
jgi:hypothetical protein